MMDEIDARKNPRYSVEDVDGSVMISHEIHVINVSLDGVAFSTGKCLQIGRIYLLKIPFGDDRITVRGEVSWCRLDGSARTPSGDIAPRYVVGMHISPGMDGDMQESYGRFLKNFRKQVCAFGKIKVEVTLAPGTSQELTLSTPFSVRKISSEHILLETDVKFPVGSKVGLDIRFGEAVHIHAAGQVVTSERTKPGVFLVSVLFSPFSPATKERLKKAVAEVYASCS